MRVIPTGGRARTDAKPLAWDIPLRMLLSTILVYTLARIGGVIGPRLSGLLTPFPVVATILTAFTHHFEGNEAAVAFLRHLV
jgi:hypothetical protein